MNKVYCNIFEGLIVVLRKELIYTQGGIRMKKTILKVIILAFFILLHKDTVYAGDEINFL